jgi:hypothetical protein
MEKIKTNKKKCPTSSNIQKPMWKVVIKQKIIRKKLHKNKKMKKIGIMKNEIKQEQEKIWIFLEIYIKRN